MPLRLLFRHYISLATGTSIQAQPFLTSSSRRNVTKKLNIDPNSNVPQRAEHTENGMVRNRKPRYAAVGDDNVFHVTCVPSWKADELTRGASKHQFPRHPVLIVVSGEEKKGKPATALSSSIFALRLLLIWPAAGRSIQKENATIMEIRLELFPLVPQIIFSRSLINSSSSYNLPLN